MVLNDLDREALAAQTDEQCLNRLIDNQKSWILRCAADTVHRYVTDSDDEWSVALLAFTEAVRRYDESRGLFKGFAALVIRRRLLDHLRAEGRHSAEIAVSPDAFAGTLPAEEATALELQVQQHLAAASVQDMAVRTREEIAAAQETLGRYGFSFFDLTECSPRADKTKRSCALAVRALLADRALLDRTRRNAALPMKELSSASGVPRKILDRHRRYIIAAAEILDGDFPVLGTYMDYIRKV
jgi:RNA polymerase sigma factor